MKLSFEWLSDFVDLSGITPEELASKLTMGAFEVEEIERHGPDIQGSVVVGEIVEINPHPDADKIRVTKIKLDENSEPQEIVCGAWNIEPGHRIPVALPGAKVINRHDGTALAIKQSKIRGVVSNGMLCSAPELGIAGNGEGILILDKSTKLGADIKELLNLKQDAILHVEPRSNRGDAMCVLGMAREVAALLGRSLKQPTYKIESSLNADFGLSVTSESTDDCPFFSGRVISEVKVGPSPAHIVRRLEAVGIRSINNVVDITNYVLHELGQPLHAYDLAKLSGPNLVVRRGKPGEKLVTLDGKEREVNPEALIIADNNGPIAIAGVMGGKHSEVTDETCNIVLEAASFSSRRVRRTSRLLGLTSDSSLRFERGVDTASVSQAADRAAQLLAEYCAAKIGPCKTAGSDKAAQQTVSLRMSELKRLTEIEMMPDAVSELLEPLGFKSHMSADDCDAGIVNVAIPSFRQKDVSREIDLIEEVCRLYGYDRIPASMPKSTMAALPVDLTPAMIRESLAACGLNEIWTSSLTAQKDLSPAGSPPAENNAVAVLNPLSPDHQALRQSLLPGLLKVAAYNQGRGKQEIWLFEVGRNYFLEIGNNGSSDNPKETSTKEELYASGILAGEPRLTDWLSTNQTAHEAAGFYTAKGIIESLCHRLNIQLDSLSFEPPTEGSAKAWFHPGRSCLITTAGQGKERQKRILLGWLGEIHPSVTDSYDVKGRIYGFELKVAALQSVATAKTMSPIYMTPTMQRDLTVDLDGKNRSSAVEAAIASLGKKILRQIELVSVFSRDQDRVSLSYRLTFQDPQETLKTELVDNLMADIRQELEQKLGASFRK
ncbi:MAG: phenylalanine--tRNA ligase subunit beta [Candidatus Obscuribacterales bacterium]|nr:phenylalanine--tRNA ligase subunit beta [Candidatus Obscuribacterales bacterium]